MWRKDACRGCHYRQRNDLRGDGGDGHSINTATAWTAADRERGIGLSFRGLNLGERIRSAAVRVHSRILVTAGAFLGDLGHFQIVIWADLASKGL